MLLQNYPAFFLHFYVNFISTLYSYYISRRGYYISMQFNTFLAFITFLLVSSGSKKISSILHNKTKKLLPNNKYSLVCSKMCSVFISSSKISCTTIPGRIFIRYRCSELGMSFWFILPSHFLYNLWIENWRQRDHEPWNIERGHVVCDPNNK